MADVIPLPSPLSLLVPSPAPRRRPRGGTIEVPSWPGPLPAAPVLAAYRGTYKPDPGARYQLAAARPRGCAPLPLGAVMLDASAEKARIAERCRCAPALVTMVAKGSRPASPRMREELEEHAGIPALAWFLWERPTWRAAAAGSAVDRRIARRPLASAARRAEVLLRRALDGRFAGSAAEVTELLKDARVAVAELQAALAHLDGKPPPRWPAPAALRP
ncbi:hypothetical protein [Polyangium sp. 6x1]|uniref:hypothetical protein n=1 Tax=Polyangium sp. 6x1 TaxID=3042689 RepID=UPI002482316A|nr:hypothetical protein [Polyangium sp. 6x1]MDI1444216.1 hypothetical protein [Polyangium sp. 6x1]